jgi:hypothetical protein
MDPLLSNKSIAKQTMINDMILEGINIFDIDW